MKLYCFLLLLLLLNNVVTPRHLSKKKERATSLDKIDELYFAQFSPFEQGALVVANYMVGFFSHFIPGLKVANKIFMKFLDSEGDCYYEDLKKTYNNITLRNGIAVWKSLDDCKKSIKKQKEYAEKMVNKRAKMIEQVKKMNKNAKTQEEINENAEITKALLKQLDEEKQELIQKENYDCEKEYQPHSFSNRLYKKIDLLLTFFDEALGKCFNYILNSKKDDNDKNVLLKIGKSIALRGINLLAKVSPAFALAKVGALFFVLFKKIYKLVKAIKSRDYMDISFRLGKITGVIVDMLTAGMLSI